MATTTKRTSRVSARLTAVSSLAEMHTILRELSESESSRWRRSQLLHFLPSAFHSAAEAYFEGERICAPDSLPAEPVSIRAEELHKVLERAESLLQLGGGRRKLPDGIRAEELEELERVRPLRDVLESAAGVPGTRIGQMLAALKDEMRIVETTAPKRYRLRDGRCVRATGGRFVYSFSWSSEPDPFVPGELRVGESRVNARVSAPAPDENAIRFELILDKYLGPEVETAVFWVDPTFLLRAVFEQLTQRDSISDAPEQRAEMLMNPPDTEVTLTRVAQTPAHLNEEQRQAVLTALNSHRSYVWGPPGTGKTTTVGALVSALVAARQRVLVLSPYNVAVDEAVRAASESVTGQECNIVRFGRAGTEVRRRGLDLESKLEALAAENGTLELARSLVAAFVAQRAGELVAPPATVRACLDEIGSHIVRSRFTADSEEAERLSAILTAMRDRFREPEESILSSADVLACTMALSFVSKKVHAAPFDHLVIDEASVVRSPEAVLAMVQTGCSVTFFGDPKQLPAIVQSETASALKWLGSSPFALARIASARDAVGSCVMLRKQHRMAPPIRAIVSELFYDGVLEDGSRAPRTGSVTILDTSASGARSTPRMVKLSNSKENTIHRAITAEVIRTVSRLYPESRVLVVSPFAAQKRAYKRERATSDAAFGTRFETVHTSQGSEQEVVIFDLVLAGSGIGTRSRMLDDRKNRYLSNLLNVAISRTKYRLVIVGDLALVERHYGDGLLSRLIAKAKNFGVVLKVPSSLSYRRDLEEVLRGR